MFGRQETPTLCRGKVVITVHLLSPARRPLQVAKDLVSFWKNGSPLVKKEIAGRYPKHYWPDDPIKTTATSGTKKSMMSKTSDVRYKKTIMNLFKTLKKPLNNKWAVSLTAVVFLVIAVLLLLPIAGKYYLSKWLLDNGADRVVIEKVRINPFAGTASLQGLTVDQGDRSVLLDNDTRVDISLMSLLKKQIDLEETVLEGLVIDIERYEDGQMRFGSYSIKPTTGETNADQDSKAVSWILSARNAALSNCRIHFKMPDLDISLQVDDAQLEKFTTAAGKLSALFTLDGSINGSPIALDLNIQQISPDISIRGTIKIDGFTLDNLCDLLKPYLTTFTGQASMDGTAAFKRTDSGDLSVEYDGLINLENGHVAGESFSVQGESVGWQKGRIHYEDSAEKQIVVTSDGLLTGKSLALSLPDLLEFKQDAFTSQGKSKVHLTSEVHVNYNGLLDFKNTYLQMAEGNSTISDLNWQGSGEVTLSADNSTILVLSGGLKSQSIEAKLIETGLLFGQQSLEIETTASVDIGQNLAIKGTGSLASDGFSLTDSSTRAPLLSLESFTIDAINGTGDKSINLTEAEAKGLDVNIEGNIPLKVSVPSIVLTDARTEDLATFNASKVTAQWPVVVAVKNNKKLAGLSSLEIRNVKTGLDQHVNVDRVNFDDFFLLGSSIEKKDNICRIGVASLSKIGWSPQDGTQGESLSFSDLYCTVIREKSGALSLSRELAAMMRSGPDKEHSIRKSEEKAPGATIQLGQVTLQGESGLHFEDHTLEIPAVNDLAITTLQIKNINSAKPSKPASVRLIGLLDKRAPLNIDGTIAPFAKECDTTMNANLKNLPLASLSAYTVQSIGVALAGGQLKLKSTLQLSGQELDMENEIVLQQLKTSTISKELADKLDNQLPVPLDAALSLLRDKDGTISLNVPISGPLEELDVGISDILITAMGKAIVPAASSYLVYTLGPYGALLWIGKELGDRMLQIRLPPVEFAPKQSKLPENIQDYFQRLVKILKDKPDSDFQLHPKSSAWEYLSSSKKEILDEKELKLSDRRRKKLMELGQKRAQSIKDYLINNYNIDQDRLLISTTQIETEKSTKPRVEIQM